MLNIDNHDFDRKEDIRSVQNVGFLKHLNYVLSASPFYKNKFEGAGFALNEIKGINDLTKIPTTTKDDLANYNDDFLCVSKQQIVEYVTTSGTLGDPVSIALTKTDLDRLAFNEARSLNIAGLSSSDTVQITTTLDKRFMAGMAYYLGAIGLEATVIRSGIGDLAFQWDNIKRYQPTVLIAVPSFAAKLGSYLIEQGEDLTKCSIEKIICIGESIRNPDFTPNVLFEKNNSLWKKQMHGTYASTEMGTAFTECEHGTGGHLLPELMLVEILDEHDATVADGELGEVTVTPLGIKGMPLLRYKTGDLARLHSGKCPCGRNTPRLGPIEGRKNQMIKYKGTTLFPQQIEHVIHGFPSIASYLIKLSLDELGQDQLEILVSDQISNQVLTLLKISLKEKLRVSPDVIASPIDYIRKIIKEGSGRKPKIFFDER